MGKYVQITTKEEIEKSKSETLPIENEDCIYRMFEFSINLKQDLNT